jgi:N-acylneuraminate cytidylyltransferase
MQRVAIIPARGGSKRLPRKNILSIMGRPMLAYPVTNAIQSGLFDQVIVTTEDAEISQAAKEAGARVLRRPDEFAHDRSTVVQVCSHVLEELRNENIHPDYFCCIYATAIFITPNDLTESYQLILEPPVADFVMGVSEFNLQPVQALEMLDGFLQYKWPEFMGVQSQFHPRLVASNGTIYWARTKVFKEVKSFYGGKLKGFEIPKYRAVDLDTPEDLKIAKIMADSILGRDLH